MCSDTNEEHTPVQQATVISYGSVFQTCLGSHPLFEVDRVFATPCGGRVTAETLLVLPQSTGDLLSPKKCLISTSGVATGLIHINNNLETWDNKLNAAIQGNNPLPDQDWIRFYQLLDDWIVSIEETAEEVGSTQKEDDRAQGIEHRK